MDFPMQSDQLERYIPKSLVYAILWSFSGDGRLKGIAKENIILVAECSFK